MAIVVDPDDQFHVSRDGVVITLSLDQLDDAYQRDQIQDDTLIWQEGLIEWMRLDTLLYTLEQQEGPVDRPASIPDVYYVMVAPEEVKQMSLDLLDDAYRLDVIDDDTLIWQPGYTEWIPLRILLGEADAHTSIAPNIPASAIVSPTSSYAPVPDFDGDDSLAPSAMWIPPEAPKASPWYGRTLVFAACLGALFVSYRTGLVESVARDFGKGDWIARVESKVGEPGTDTPHGLQRYLSHLETEHGLATLSETEPVPEVEPKAKKPKATKDDSKQESENEAGEPNKAKTDPTDPKALPQADATANAFSNVLQGKPKVAPKKVQRPVRRSAGPTKFKGGDPNDPMNGSL